MTITSWVLLWDPKKTRLDRMVISMAIAPWMLLEKYWLVFLSSAAFLHGPHSVIMQNWHVFMVYFMHIYIYFHIFAPIESTASNGFPHHFQVASILFTPQSSIQMLLVKTYLMFHSKIAHNSKQFSCFSIYHVVLFICPSFLLLCEGRSSLVNVYIYSIYPSSWHLAGSE